MSAQQKANFAKAEAVLTDLIDAGVSGEVLGDDLYGVATVLKSNNKLLQALTDPGRELPERVALVRAVFGGHIDAATLDVVSECVNAPWSHPEMLIKSIDDLGRDAFIFVAKANGEGEELAQELVNVMIAVEENRHLRIQLSELGVGKGENRSALARSIFSGRVSAIAVKLIENAAQSAEYGKLVQTFRHYAGRVAELGDKTLVVVTTAKPLTPAQKDRMRDIVDRKWSRPVLLTTVIDPDLIGGFRIDGGAGSFDTSVRTDLLEARLLLTK